MSLFDDTLDEECEKLGQALGRDLKWGETTELRERLFSNWIKSRKFDELIEYAIDEYELEGGRDDIGQLSDALAKQGESVRLERLFAPIVKNRIEAFFRIWPKALEGHIGAMREAAVHMASTMNALAEQYHGYWVLKDQTGMERVTKSMLALQERHRA